MADILTLKNSVTGLRLKRCRKELRQSSGAEIIIFPGVRYERDNRGSSIVASKTEVKKN
ncbi:MAG: hypothetical protein V3V04_07095 [Rhizobiaceae bacterium]